MPMTTRGKNRATSSEQIDDDAGNSSNDEQEQLPTETIKPPSPTPAVTEPVPTPPPPKSTPAPPKPTPVVREPVSMDYEETQRRFSDSDSEYESEGERRRKRKLPYAKRVKKEIEEKAARKKRKLSVDVDSSQAAGIPPAFPETVYTKGTPMVEKILAHRVDPTTSAFEYLVKWKDRSYLHIAWVGPEEFQRERYSKTKLQRYHNKGEVLYDESEELFNPAFVEADRVIGHAEKDGVTKYLVKWHQMSYLESSWELPQDVGDDKKIEEYHERQKVPSPNRWRPKPRPLPKAWKAYEESPVYKGGNQLRPYQLEGLNWLTFCWYNRRNSILADEMGLGKTVQTVVMLNHLFEDVAIHGPFLIVAPLITIPHWQREFEGWTNINVVVYHGNAPARDVIRNFEFYYDQKKAPPYKFNVLITTYEMAMSDVSLLGKIHWNYVAVDEAHRLKNKNCKLINVLRTFRIDHLLLLTGTPLQNNTDELWTLLNFMDPEKFASADEFAEQFGELKETHQVEELHSVLRPYLLRRMKEDVEKGIAPKEETVVEVELTTIQKSYYRAIYEKNFSSLNMGTKSTNVPSLLNIMMQLRKCCNHPFLLRGVEDNIMGREQGAKSDENQLMIEASGKLVLIDKLLPKLQAGGHKVLIFSQMVRMLDILEDYLIHKSYLYERIDGTKRGNERQEAIDRFSAPDSDRFVFLLCTRAGGLGINLTAADTCIIYDSDWNPQNDIQAQARCHRIGQTQMVKIYRLITRNTYEKVMFDKASRKLGLDQAVLTKMKSGASAATTSASQGMSQNAALRAMDRKEIDQLLKYGAYGAFDETEHDSYIEEDIDKILERNSTTIVHNPLGGADAEGGQQTALSSFSKASFISAEAKSNANLDVFDPDFWKKLMPDKKISNPLIQAKPRTRAKVQRYSLRGAADRGAPFYESSGSEASDNDDNDEFEGTAGWTSRERSKLKSTLAFYGYGQWYTAKDHGNIFRWSAAQIKAYTDILIRNCILQIGEEPETLLQYLQTYCIYEKPPAEPQKNDNLAIEDFMDFSDDPSLTDPKFSLYKYSNAKLFIRRLESVAKISKAVLQTYEELGGELMPIPELAPDPPCESWTQEDDRSLILGTYYHGYGRYEKIRTDPRLSFSRFVLDPSSSSLEQNPSTDGSGLSSAEETNKQVEEWPSEKLLNRRLRKVLRLVTLDDEAREKHQLKKEKIEKAQRKDRQARRGYSHSEWSKREKAMIYRFSVTFGIPMPDSDNEDWNQFKMQAGITRKPISQIKEYCAGLLAYADMTVKGAQSVFTIDSDVFIIDHFVESDLKLSTAQSKRLLQRVHMFREIRAKLLPRMDELPELLQSAQMSQALPLWWRSHHDLALITGLSKHGFGQWEKLCADQDLPFYHLAEERLALSEAQEKAKLAQNSLLGSPTEALVLNSDQQSRLVSNEDDVDMMDLPPPPPGSEGVSSSNMQIPPLKIPSNLDSSQDIDMAESSVPPPSTSETPTSTKMDLDTVQTKSESQSQSEQSVEQKSQSQQVEQKSEETLTSGGVDEKEEPLDEDSDSIPDDDDPDGEPRRRRGRRADVYTTAVDFPKEKVIMKRLDYLIQFVDRPEAFSGGVVRKLTPHPFKIEKPLSSSSGSVPSTPDGKSSKSGSGTPGSNRKHKICAGRKPAIKKYTEIPLEPDGSPKFPIMFGKMRIESLGQVVYDRTGFHNDRYIWPVGYKSVRPYSSFVNPLTRTEYCSEIADGGDRPLFVVTAMDAPDRPGKGTSPTAAWTSILRKLNEKSNKPFNAVSGPEYFGLAKGIISKLIQELPNADKCFNYQKQEFLLDSEQPPRKKRKANKPAAQSPVVTTPQTPSTPASSGGFEEIKSEGTPLKTNSSVLTSPQQQGQGKIPAGALIDYPPPPPSSILSSLPGPSDQSPLYGTLSPPMNSNNSFVRAPFAQPTFTNVTFNFGSPPVPPPPVPRQYMESDSAIPFPVMPNQQQSTQFSPHHPNPPSSNPENPSNFPF